MLPIHPWPALKPGESYADTESVFGLTDPGKRPAQAEEAGL